MVETFATNKLESSGPMGHLAGSVAHELNNILSGLISYPELILMNMPEDSEHRPFIKKIQECGQRMSSIVQDLLQITQGVTVKRRMISLNQVISDYLKSSEHFKLKQLYPEITVKTDMDPRLSNVHGSLSHITNAVIHLVSNAADAVADNGEIVISTTNRRIDQPLKGYDDIEVGEYAVLTVADNGPILISDDPEKIFEPFYSTKVLGRSGTGLGLPLIRHLVQEHDGYIHMTADENGSKFELYFPVTGEAIQE
jgi:two-component system, cell cycle sensor histidine kinase and response regulator CckA